MRTRLLAVVGMMAVLAGGAIVEADEGQRHGGESEGIEKVRTILAALRVTREVVEMMEDPLLSGQLAIQRVKELAIEGERLEQGAGLLVRMSGGTDHPALKRSALFAASELLAKADKFEAAAAVAARVMMVGKPPAEPKRRVPQPLGTQRRALRGRVQRMPRPDERPPGLPSGPPRTPPMYRDDDRRPGPPRPGMGIRPDRAPEQAERAEQLQRMGERVRRAAEDIERRERELRENAERIEHRERETREHAEGMERRRRELDERAEELEHRKRELDKRAEELETRAERLDKLAEELERRGDRAERPSREGREPEERPRRRRVDRPRDEDADRPRRDRQRDEED